MKFGGVASLKGIDLSLPPDHPDTPRVLGNGSGVPRIHVGFAKTCLAMDGTFTATRDKIGVVEAAGDNRK